MRRADRLFDVIQILRAARKPVTAATIAGKLEVTVRTVYRDVATLQARRVPIEGAAGIGYVLRKGFDLPPLMFTTDEAKALVACVRLAQPRLDAALAEAAEGALSKVLAVLPTGARAAAESLAVYAPYYEVDPRLRQHLEALRVATESRRKVRLHYLDLKEVPSQRTVRPLGSFYWGAVWTLAAWCEVREDFRSFRVDRIERLEPLDERFRDEAGKTLADLFRREETRAPSN